MRYHISVDVFVEPLDRNFWVHAEEVVAVEAVVGALDLVQVLLGDGDRVVDVLHVLGTRPPANVGFKRQAGSAALRTQAWDIGMRRRFEGGYS
jgi:hypothetical protein